MKELINIHYFNKSEFLDVYIAHKLFQQFLDTGKHFLNKQFVGQIEDIDSFCEELEKVSGTKKVFEQIEETEKTVHYFSDNNYICVYIPNSKKITLDITTDTSELIESISFFLSEKFSKIEKEKQIHMIAPDEYTEQVSLYPMGNVSFPLNRKNYDEETLKKVDYVIKELNSENPTGRMVLVDGFAGTGKSYLIRGILNQLNFGICVLVPASMLDNLDKPTLIPLLMKNKTSRNIVNVQGQKSKGNPIVLIIEDADSILTPRAADNMSAISSLLNYTDGIFGMLFDLRIIATTNASHVEIEKALLRPGRLLKRIHVGLLKSKKAEEIYESLTGQKRDFEKEVSLATVYSLAKGNEIDDIDDDKNKNEHHQRTVGF